MRKQLWVSSHNALLCKLRWFLWIFQCRRAFGWLFGQSLNWTPKLFKHWPWENHRQSKNWSICKTLVAGVNSQSPKSWRLSFFFFLNWTGQDSWTKKKEKGQGQRTDQSPWYDLPIKVIRDVKFSGFFLPHKIAWKKFLKCWKWYFSYAFWMESSSTTVGRRWAVTIAQ